MTGTRIFLDLRDLLNRRPELALEGPETLSARLPGCPDEAHVQEALDALVLDGLGACA